MHSGWTILDNLYILNGTFFIVTDKPSEFPKRRMMIGSGYIVKNTPEEVAKREPTDKDMRIISIKEAGKLFGTSASRLDGVTVSLCCWVVGNYCVDFFQFLNNDPPQCTYCPEPLPKLSDVYVLYSYHALLSLYRGIAIRLLEDILIS